MDGLSGHGQRWPPGSGGGFDHDGRQRQIPLHRAVSGSLSSGSGSAIRMASNAAAGGLSLGRDLRRQRPVVLGLYRVQGVCEPSVWQSFQTHGTAHAKAETTMMPRLNCDLSDYRIDYDCVWPNHSLSVNPINHSSDKGSLYLADSSAGTEAARRVQGAAASSAVAS